MPNWCKGNIRLRGERSSIIEFLKNEIAFTGTVPREFEVKELSPVYSEGYGFGEFHVNYPNGVQELLFKAYYIRNTRRNFIDDKSIDFYFDDENNKEVLCIDGFSAAWGIDSDPYVEKAKKYGIDIKIIGYEKGMMFRQEIEIVNGVLVKNEELSWKETNDWYWNAEQPNLGG